MTEFYDQKKWLEMHRSADELMATQDGKIILAIYKSPFQRNREEALVPSSTPYRVIKNPFRPDKLAPLREEHESIP
jgi:hypothetical protein